MDTAKEPLYHLRIMLSVPYTRRSCLKELFPAWEPCREAAPGAAARPSALPGRAPPGRWGSGSARPGRAGPGRGLLARAAELPARAAARAAVATCCRNGDRPRPAAIPALGRSSDVWGAATAPPGEERAAREAEQSSGSGKPSSAGKGQAVWMVCVPRAISQLPRGDLYWLEGVMAVPRSTGGR